MAGSLKAHIFVVDDDSSMLEAICVTLSRAEYGCTCLCFENVDDCLQRLREESCDLLITDVKMPGKDGIELLTEAKRIVPWLPVLVMTAYADIPLAVRSIRAGAVEFIEKPFEWQAFLAVVESALQKANFADLIRDKPLTKMEAIVLHLILQGRTNKEIAYTLHRSERTVEVHRSHIMHKLDVDNAVELVRRATAMGLGEAT